MGIRTIICLSCLSIPILANAQENIMTNEVRALVEERIELLSTEQLDNEADYTAQIEFLEIALLDPIHLNNADATKLRSLQLLSESQIIALIDHVKRHGKLLAFEELLSIPCFDAATIRLIRPFCSLDQVEDYPDPRLSLLLSEGQSNFFLRHSRILQKASGYRSKDYLGSRDKIYARYRYQYNRRLSIGFSAEKDAGEEFLKGSQKQGFDFYSAHLFIQDWKGFDKIAIGDYQAQFGQGLTYWSGLALGNGLGVTALKRVGQGLLPYTSVQENSFLRGIGLEKRVGILKATLFLSNSKSDGRSILQNGQAVISGFPGNGLHRTSSELERKGNLTEQLAGTHLKYHHKRIEIGFTAIGRSFNRQLSRSATLYRRFHQVHNKQFNVGIDYARYFSNLLVYGETSRSINGAIASLNGILWAGSRGFQFGLLHRYYERDYHPIQSNALGTNSGNYNERGLFWNMESPISRQLKIILNYNLYRFPWLRFQVDAPSKGMDRIAELKYSPNKSLELYFRYRERNRERNSRTNLDGIDPILSEESRNFRIHLNYQLSELFRWQNRIEWRRYILGSQREQGILIYQDLTYNSLQSPISISIRFAVFDCPSFESRIYAYERDVLYAFSIPAYSGIGNRYYLLLQWSIKKGIDVWIRYDNTAYQDRDEIGSGRDLILGNQKAQLKTQLRLSF